MSIFDDLNEQYVQYDAALTLQHQQLVRAVGDMAVGYERFLGITKTHWFNDDGTKGERYVRLGVGDPDRFQEKGWFQLSSVGGSVDFSIAITLESPESVYPRFTFVFEGNACFVDEGYEFTFEGIPYPIVVSPLKVKNLDFNSVHDALTLALKSEIDPSKVAVA